MFFMKEAVLVLTTCIIFFGLQQLFGIAYSLYCYICYERLSAAEQVAYWKCTNSFPTRLPDLWECWYKEADSESKTAFWLANPRQSEVFGFSEHWRRWYSDSSAECREKFDTRLHTVNREIMASYEAMARAMGSRFMWR